ncbi:MAG: substrate-binding domain-containing protein [Lachnospiraceae bacterium]|nr:substrate-binding domain-containing protein [Lachnospiraceae bacterium]
MKLYFNNRKMISSIAVLLIFMVVLIFAMNKGKEKELHVIYIPKTQIGGNDFWSSIRAGAEAAAKENNVQLEIFSPSDETHVEEQNQLIKEAVAMNPDAIVVSPASNTENNDALCMIKEARIPLVYIDSTTDEKIADAIVATDNVAAGKKMAEIMLGLLNQDSKIAIVSHVKDSSTAMEREKGFRKGLLEYESQITDVVYSNSIDEIGYRVTKELLEREPDINYLACLNEDSAVGAAKAVKELGLVNQIFIVGFDNSSDEIKRLEEGVFQAIVVQRAFTMGYFGIENAAKLAKGESVAEYLDSGSVLITKENMYQDENQELLFPFY